MSGRAQLLIGGPFDGQRRVVLHGRRLKIHVATGVFADYVEALVVDVASWTPAWIPEGLRVWIYEPLSDDLRRAAVDDALKTGVLA